MWSRISHALKPQRQANEDAESPTHPGDVMTRVFEQHPNLSVFQGGSELPFPAPSPPSSPSKNGRRGMFKRLSKVSREDTDSLRAPSPMRLPGLPKKVKSGLNLNGNNSQLSFSRPSQEILRKSSLDMLRSSFDSSRPSQDIPRKSSHDMLRPSLDSQRPPTDVTSPDALRTSFESIRPPQVIMSKPSNDMLLPSNKPTRLSIDTGRSSGETLRRPSLDMLRSAPSTSWSAKEVCFSPEPLHTLHEDNSDLLTNLSNLPGTDKLKSILPEMDSFSPSIASSPFTKNRSRAMSDTVFMSMMRSPSTPVEADINDEASSEIVVYSRNAATPEPDPFHTNATTYYTPQTMIPVTPPQGAPKHTRKTSKEESIIFSLQTQLALQTELSAQYEADLRARDELVEILGKKMTDVEKEESKRKGVLRSWKKKVAELEKACRYLEEEVEGSRQESMERSIMDEASGEALRMLHRQIASLERERSDWARTEQILREQIDTLEGLVKDRSADVSHLKEMLSTRDESERELQEGIREAKEQIEMLGNISMVLDDDQIRSLVLQAGQGREGQEEGHSVAAADWEEERAELTDALEALKVENAAVEEDLQCVKEQLMKRDEEYGSLKEELEAQWQHTEKATETIQTLETEKLELEKVNGDLQHNVQELEERLETMDLEWNENEGKKSELENEIQDVWATKEALETERDQLEEQLNQEREHADNLTHSLQEYEDRVTELDQERQFAVDNVARLEDNVRQRDQEIAEYSEKLVQCEAEAEQLREEMSNLRREHSRALGEQNRALQEASGQEGEARVQMESLVRQKAEADVEIKTFKDRVRALQDEVERLRRQVHELQQESADKEVRIVQITKQRFQDKEDLNGLNMALDAKQQELELIKRQNGVKGTAGSTPAQPSRVALHRRESSTAFNTPTISRPSSVLSNTSKDGSKGRKLSDPPSSGLGKAPALKNSVRVNGTPSGFASTSSTATKPTRGVEGSMGPPPMKPRSSMATPTPTARGASLSRSSSAKPSTSGTPVPHRRVSSATLDRSHVKSKMSRPLPSISPAPSLSEQDEKENVDSSSSISSTRRTMIATPA